MSQASTPAASRPAIRLAPLLAVLVLSQVMNALFGNSISVYGPVVTADLGIPTQSVGIWISLMFVTGIVSSFLLVGTAKRLGPVRSTQAAIVLHGLGFVLPAASALGGGRDSAIAAYVAGALLMGLGAGIILPASSQILQRVTPPGRLGVVFSIKQTGVPFAIAIAGVLVPALLTVMSWRASLVVIASGAIVIIALLQVYRPVLDDERDPTAPLSGAGVIAPLRLVAGQPVLRILALSGALFGGVQLATIGYLVTYLKVELGLSLAAAGAAWSAAQISTVFGRVSWGWLADRTRSPLGVIGILALGSGLMSLVIASMRPEWSYTAMVLACVGYIVFSMGWNGVHLAAIARYAPPGQLAESMVGTQFTTFLGMLGGPLLFAAIVSASGRYAVAFAAFAAFSIAGGVVLLRLRKTGR